MSSSGSKSLSIIPKFIRKHYSPKNVINRYLPDIGGGTLRRWFKFEKNMFLKSWGEPDVTKNSPLPLFDFHRHDDAIDAALHVSAGGESKTDVWRISDDSVIGGYSNGTLTMIRTKNDYKRYLANEKLKDTFAYIPNTYYEDEEENDDNNKEDENDDVLDNREIQKLNFQKEMNKKKFRPFLRWKGYLNTKIGLRSNVQRSGFVHIRSPDFPFDGANLQGLYNALEVVCRTDGRMYTMNIKINSFFPGDVYQAVIAVPPTHPDKRLICHETGGHFHRLIYEFDKLLLVADGRVREKQRKLDNRVEIENIGFTIMDNIDGEFQLDIARVRAVYSENGEILGPKRPLGEQ